MSEKEWLSESAARLSAWLADARPTEPSLLLHEILSKSPATCRALTEQFAPDERLSIAARLLERTVTLGSRSYSDAILAGRLAIIFARAYDGANDDNRNRALLIEANAQRENAWSFMQLGDYDDAMLAAEEAALSYRLLLNEVPDDASGSIDLLHGDVLAQYLTVIAKSRWGPAEPMPESRRLAMENATRLGLTIGELLHKVGRTEEGLVMIERSCEVLLYFLDRKDRYVRGRTIYAMILGETHRWSEALQVFESTSALAADADDLEVQAFLLGNIGVCYYYLGYPIKAKDCAETAMRMFEDLELHVDAIRPRTLLVLLLMEEGPRNRAKYSNAAAELFKSRATWLAAGMKIEAAEVMVQIIRALLLAGRPQDINWPEMMHAFSVAGLRDEAMAALRHLRDVALQRTLLLSDVDDAEAILARLGRSGEATIQQTG